MPALYLTSPVDGDLLNHHDGRPTADGLTITVRGTAPPQATVVVAGVPVNADAGVFACEVTLREPVTTLVAVCGELRAEATVYWDRHASRRYRFSTDDNIYFLRDLAAEPHRSLFDQPYLAFWRRMHERYGTRVQHNIYWGEPEGFDLSRMPDRYRGEWADHADWLHLTFHAAADQPAKPYLTADYATVARDFDRVTEQIVRFAGETVLSPFTTVHWGEATYDGCRALADRGIRGLAGYAHLDRNTPPGAVGQAQVSYYLSAEETRHLAARDAWRCHRSGLWFIKHDLVCNSHPPEAIRPHLDSVFVNPHRRELMEVMIHEQYFCPFLERNYQPDVEQRVEEALAWLVEHEYRSVFYEEGLLGSPAP